MKRILFILLSILTSLCGYAQEPSFVAKSPGTVVVGNPFYLQYVLSAKGENLRAPAFDGFQQKAGPTLSQSTSLQIINGKTSRDATYTYTYVLVAEKEGTFAIQPATIESDGKRLTSNSLTINVVAGNQAIPQESSGSTSGISDRDIFLRATVNKTSPFQDEALLYTVKLYTRLNVSNITSANFPAFNSFLASDLDKKSELTEEIENYNGLVYRTYTVHQKLLYPQRGGELRIDPATINVNIRIRTQRRSYNIFDDIFDSYQDVGKQLRSNALTLNVKPLPSGKPSGFEKLVGKFSLRSEISASDITANEPVTLKLVLTGEGNQKMLSTPEPKFPMDFEKYDPKVTNNLRTTMAGETGSRTFEYLVIPRFGGEFTIPAINIPYFDPQSGSYKTLKSQAFTINVARSETPDQGGVVSNFRNQEDVKFIGSDIRYINTENLTLKQKGKFLFGSNLFWFLLVIPVVAYLLILIIYRKQVREKSNIALAKNKRANKVARKRLKSAALYMKKDNYEAFYDEVLRALWGYTSDKLNIPLSKLNKDNVEDILKEKQVDDMQVKQLIDLMNTCEYARYAPASVEGGMNETYKNAVSVISGMDNKIRK